MGELVIHAGMSKTGSSSLQRWLSENHELLATEHGVWLHQETGVAKGGGIDFEPFTLDRLPGVANSFLLRHVATRRAGEPGDELTDELADALDRAARTVPRLLFTQELLEEFVSVGDPPLLRALQALTTDHQVRVIYYVRPQDSSLEARWRQWGFREGLAPSAWVRSQLHLLRYGDTAAAMAELCPDVAFEVRPFRRDLLVDGDIVPDFARAVLGLDGALPSPGEWQNVGSLPLDLSILLRHAPKDVLERERVPGQIMDLGGRILDLGALGYRWDIPLSENAIRSRALLKAWAWEHLEPQNRRFLGRAPWPDDHLITPPDTAWPEEPPDLERLDELWDPAASQASVDYLHAALREIFAT